jgi:hypothetical protein
MQGMGHTGSRGEHQVGRFDLLKSLSCVQGRTASAVGWHQQWEEI